MLEFPFTSSTHTQATLKKNERNIICYDVEKLNWLQLSALICVAFHSSSLLEVVVVVFQCCQIHFLFNIIFLRASLYAAKKNFEKCLRCNMNSIKTDDNFLLISYLFNLVEIYRLRYRSISWCLCVC